MTHEHRVAVVLPIDAGDNRVQQIGYVNKRITSGATADERQHAASRGPKERQQAAIARGPYDDRKDLMAAGGEIFDEMAADESAGAGYRDAHSVPDEHGATTAKAAPAKPFTTAPSDKSDTSCSAARRRLPPAD